MGRTVPARLQPRRDSARVKLSSNRAALPTCGITTTHDSQQHPCPFRAAINVFGVETIWNLWRKTLVNRLFAMYQLCLERSWVGKHIVLLVVLKPPNVTVVRGQPKPRINKTAKTLVKKHISLTFPFKCLTYFFRGLTGVMGVYEIRHNGYQYRFYFFFNPQDV